MADGAAPLSAAVRRDRLSALSDDLLHQIITQYLPVTEAAKTAALARRWRHLWSSTPLVLRDAAVPEPARDALVPRVLAKHEGHFRTVALHDLRLASLDRELPGWPRLVAAKHTQELHLANRCQANDILPLVPADILRCGSLEELLLGSWAFPVDLSRGAGVSLPNLRKLTLVTAAIEDRDLQHLITACTALEILKLAGTTAKRIHLCSPSLRCATVTLSRDENLAVVDAPLLERLVLFLPATPAMVKIDRVANLRVLGHLDTRRLHRLQIRDTLIELNTMASTSTAIPSVRILAVTVNFVILREVKMLASFLRCFPNIDTLHIESALHDPSVTANEHSAELHASFWQGASPVECLRSHVKKMVIHEFRADQNEFEFLKFVAMNSQELQSLHVVLQEENTSSTDKGNDTREKLQSLRFQTGVSAVLLVLPKEDSISSMQKATDLTFDDPFRF
ncbi:putative F-box/LRR-repeat protein At3g28410 [Lolium rigidum]|uniref:putative F-box/LRR-repeat protein At3g28410 n=1 Tax=Lolium rigidum TaxID=89674 RepID=UPI001F5D2B9E|nr:putative F-box/LRR-repeat protein At3g28410 [Lolium rigidum]